MNEKLLGEFLKTERRKKKISLRNLEGLSGISFSHLSKIERGEYTPSRTTVSLIARALNLDEDKLLVMAGYSPFIFKADPEKLEQLSKDIFLHRQENEMVSVPILSTIQEGKPFDKAGTVEGYEMVESKVLKNREAAIISVKDNAMTGDSIKEGDRVIVVAQEDTTPSDIVVVAVIGQEPVIRRVKRQNNICILVASNPEVEPIFVDEKAVRVIGKVVEVRRSLQ